MVRPMAGLRLIGSASGFACAIIPASACAAFANTRSEMRLMPETSVTEYIMQMSEDPT